MSKLITITPPAMRELNAAFPRDKLIKQKFIKDLKPMDQDTLFSATKGVMHSMALSEVGNLGQGFYLAQGHAVLAVKGTWSKGKDGKHTKNQSFGKWVRMFRMTQRTAQRKITAYKNAKTYYHDNILKAAMVRGMTLSSHSTTRPLGQLQEIVKALPPPKSPTPEKANEYLDQLTVKLKERRQRISKKEKTKEEEKVTLGDPAMLLKMSYRSLSSLVKRLPSRSRRTWLEGITGMMMTLVGISTEQRFEPCAIPEDYQPKRGRPASSIKKEEGESKAS